MLKMVVSIWRVLSIGLRPRSELKGGAAVDGRLGRSTWLEAREPRRKCSPACCEYVGMPDKKSLLPSAHREQLIYLLTEAAELEHGLMCTYLFAGFSLRREAEGLSERERAAIERWRGSIREVAIEEMLQLVIVQNLLTSIGGAPHLQRPNFPVSPGLYPSGLVLQLRRFDEAALDPFVFLEPGRPRGPASHP